MMNLKPLGDRVIVKQDEAEETTAGGLILAHDAKEKPQTGVVLKVGEGKLDKDGNLVPVPVKEGDRVLYGKYGGRGHDSSLRGHLRGLRIALPTALHGCSEIAPRRIAFALDSKAQAHRASAFRIYPKARPLRC